MRRNLLCRPASRRWIALLSLLTACALTGAGVATAAAPSNSSAPTISGTAKVGSTLTTTNGTWAGSPTTYSYQWQRCSGTSCSNIVGATQKTYTVTTADVGHSLRAVVTATNADGLSTAHTSQTAVVPAVAGAPKNTLPPVILGDAWVGQTLRAAHGQWSGDPTSFAYQWLRCDLSGGDCFAIDGATGETYGVRLADVYSTLRVDVTGKNANGVTTARSDATNMVQPLQPVVVAGNQTPKLTFLSLKRRGLRAYARFRVCDDSGRISVIERDSKSRRLPYVRKYTVYTQSCTTASRTWKPAPRFRTKGRFLVTLRAVDKSGQSSRFTSRWLRWK